MARLIARWVLPTPGGPSSTTFSLRSMKLSSCKLSICSRLMEGWKEKSNVSNVFTTGSREERIAACSRLGGGKKLFADGSAPHSFNLTRSRVSPNGLIVGHYEREGEIKIGDTTLDAPSEREIARRKRMKREG